MTAFHLLTGEYPPQAGGVSDYCAQVAEGLAAAGHRVHVWCPGAEGDPAESGVEIHRRPGLFSPRGLRQLGAALDAAETPRRLLLQYAPNALGMRGLNLPACLWLLARARRDDVRVMFHEPYLYFGWRRPQRNILAAVQRLMAVCLLGASRRVYVSSATWERYLSPFMWLGPRQLMWLPVPSTVPAVADDAAVAERRKRLTAGARELVGHFGTYGDHIRPLVERCFATVGATRPETRFVCLGRNSRAFVDRLVARHPDLSERVVAADGLSADDVSTHLQACDVVVQPFAEGVTTRRTSLMASLINGRPTVTTDGPLTEGLWREEPGVALVPIDSGAALAERVASLLDDAETRDALGHAGQALYSRRFALEHVVRHLIDQPENPLPVT